MIPAEALAQPGKAAPTRLARITLSATVLLDADDSVDRLTPEDVRDILQTAISRRQTPRLKNAGSFGEADRTWTGVYEVEKQELLASAMTPPLPIALPDLPRHAGGPVQSGSMLTCEPDPVETWTPAGAGTISDPMENGRALERMRRDLPETHPLAFRRVELAGGGVRL